MTKNTKTRRVTRFKNIISRVIKTKSNTNIMGDMSFAESQAKKNEALNILFHELEDVCGDRQAQDIINTVRLAQSGDVVVDCLPVMALGETLQFVRGEVRKSIKQVRACQIDNNIVDLESINAKQRLDQMITLYGLVMHGYYTMYGRFMTAMQTSNF